MERAGGAEEDHGGLGTRARPGRLAGGAGDGAPDAPAPFGALVRRHRRAAGLTQEALAARAGVGLRTLQALEAGRQRPQRGTAARLAPALGLYLCHDETCMPHRVSRHVDLTLVLV